MAYEALRALPWFIGAGAQQQCFDAVDERALHRPLYIKFNEPAFSFVPRELIPAFAELFHVVHPHHTTPRHPCLLTLARKTDPVQLFFDIEWVEDTERSIDDALEVIFAAWRQVEALMDDEWDHDCDDWKLYISHCSRWKGEKWYNSYHVTARCSNECAFADFDHLKRFSDRMFHRFNQLSPEHKARYFIGKGGSLLFDTIYTKNRAFRMLYSSKQNKETGVFSPPMRLVPRENYTGAPDDHEDLLRHLHSYVLEGYPLLPDVAVLEGNRCQRTGRRPPQRERVIVDDALTRYYQHLASEALYYDARSHSYRSRDDGLDGVFRRLLDRPAYRQETIEYYKPYQQWYRTSIKLASFLDREFGFEMWMKFCEHIDKNDEPAAQWHRTCAWLAQRGEVTTNLEQQRHSFLDEFARLEGIPDWRVYLPERFFHYDCPLAVGVAHPQPIELRILPNPLNTTIVECSQCRKRECWGLPCEGTNVRLMRTRYVSSDDEAREDLLRVTRTHVWNQRRRTLIYACPMGTGKSHLLGSHEWGDVSVCIVLSRRLLLDAFVASLRKKALPRLYHYEENKTAIRGIHSWERATPADRSCSVATVLDSLPRIVNRGGRTPRFDVVVLEEIESLLAHCSSDTLGARRVLVFDVLRHLVRSATVVVALDADFGERAHRFLLELRSDTAVRIHRNLATPLGRNHYLYHQASAFFSRLVASVVRDRKKVFVVANVKNELQAIARVIEERWTEINIDDEPLRILLLTRDSNVEDRRAVKDASIEWTAYDVVMWTPVIDSGVDFNPAVAYFEEGFVLHRRHSSSIRSIEQQAGRVRCLTDGGCMHYYIDTRDADPTAEPHTIESLYNEHLANLERLPRDSPYKACITGDHIKRKVLKFNKLTRVLLANELEALASAQRPLEVYRAYCDLHGNQVTRVFDFPRDISEAYTVGDSLVRIITREVNDEDTIALRDSQRLEVDMADAVDCLQQQEQAPDPIVMRKEMMCRLLNVPDITDVPVIEFLKDHAFQSKMLTFMLVMGPVCASDHYVRTLYALDVAVPPDLTLDFRAYIDRLELPGNHPLKSQLEVQRADLIRELMTQLGLTRANFESTKVRRDAVDHLHRTFFLPHALSLKKLSSRVKWDKVPHGKNKRATRVAKVFEMANLKFTSARRGLYELEADSVYFMANMAALLLPQTFRWPFAQQPPFFAELLGQ